MGYVKPKECEGCRHWSNDYDGCFMERGGFCENFSYWEKGYYELVEQIEKMKNCYNCSFYWKEPTGQCGGECPCNKWSLK